MTVADREVMREVPLMPGGRRLLGHALQFGRDPLALFQQAREYGDVVRIRFGPFRVYVLNSPGVIRQALVAEATIAWACYLLARHPQLQERLQEEVDLVLGGADASFEILDRLSFTRAVITEALRLYSPVWILPRRALVDVELGGHLLRAGSRIFFSPYALNRDARLHRDPDRFDPDRWATDYSRSDMRAVFFPFGQGIRNCIGEGFAWTESILLLSTIAARWQLRLADGAAVHPVVSSTLVPSELPITVTRRRQP